VGRQRLPEYLDLLEGVQRSRRSGCKRPSRAIRTSSRGERGGDTDALPTDEELTRMTVIPRQRRPDGAYALERPEPKRKTSSGDLVGTLTGVQSRRA